MHLSLSWRYGLALFCLTGVCGTAHELIHHVTAFAVCGCWGYKTFNSYDVCSGCTTPWTLLATLAGPVFSFAAMWWGWALMGRASARQRGVGLALVFANLPLNRLGFPLLGMNDEHAVAYELLGPGWGARGLTQAVVLAVGLPPLMRAWHTLGNARRGRWFTALLVLPLLVVIVVVGMGLENLILEKQFLWQTLWGVPYLVLAFELACTVGYYRWRTSLWEEVPYPQG